METLKFISGQGYDYSNENGLFEVRSFENKIFNKLSEAKQYYEKINENKSIWDITEIPELLESHSF